MRFPGRFSGLIVAGLAPAGAALGHALGYLLAEPDGTARHEHLALTGHGSFAVLGCLAAVSAGAVLVLAAARAASSSGTRRVGPTALALALIQVPAFGWMELAERGFSLARAAGDPAVLLGLTLQVLVALGVAALLGAVERVARAVASRRRSLVRAAPTEARPPQVRVSARRAVLLSDAPRRAPPLPLAV